MRQLNPKVADERKHKVLRWVVHNYIKTSRPIASSIIAEEADLELSSATIRSILKELEEEGYVYQPHTSSGRVPTDRGYRRYVDFLEHAQRLASQEKARIEQQYYNQTEELDRLLSETSKLLSHISRKTGLVLSPKIEGQKLRRLELIPIAGAQVLAVVVTETGQVRHWPVKLSSAPSAERVHILNRFLNDNVQGKSIQEVRSTLGDRIERAERELRELQMFANSLLGRIDVLETPEELYLDGAVTLMEGAEEFGDLSEIQSMMRVMEEREALLRVLQEDFSKKLELSSKSGTPLVRVRIGEECCLPELKNLSLVTTTYRMGDRNVGVLGILGSKRMEYPRMISLVDYISQMVSRTLESWESEQHRDEF
ncbi:MAG: heat-inducible transcriptional repressor HrcA [Elusimicrobiota bacterium]